MERARVSWTDERLDDLSRHVESGFARVDEDVRALRTDVHARFDALEGRLDSRFQAVDSRIDGLQAMMQALQRTMLQVGGGMTVAILLTLLSVILTRA